MGALEKGSLAKHMGSCQTVHALGCGRVCVAVCERGLSKGWAGFWGAWKTQWQGYIEEERGSCARQHVRASMFECDTRSRARMGGMRWSMLGVMPSVIKQQWEITELCLAPPWGVLGILISTEHQLYWRSTDFKTPESHIIFYWNLCGGFKQSVTKHSAHTQQPDSKCFFYYCGAYNIDVEMESLFIHISFFFASALQTSTFLLPQSDLCSLV